MLFSELGLAAEIVRAVSEEGYTEPTPVQSQAIPVIMDGQDILAGAQTGTGKTAGFTLPLLHKLHNKKPAGNKRHVRALILTPTRELAAQVHASVNTYGKYLPLKAAAIYGGVSINPQISQLRRGVDILIATPGRLLDHVNQRTVDLSKLEVLVLDEADRMLDMGFIQDIRRLIALLPANGRDGRQNLLFSATFSEEIRRLAGTLLDNPAHIEVARRNTTVETVEQIVYPVDRERKRELLSYLIGSQNLEQVLVFSRTKHGASRLAEQLQRDGIRADAIHGNKSQAARTKALSRFKTGNVQVLVATEIAARGLDIDRLPFVVNFDLPNVAEDYVHRIGRTGRAGNEGKAISLVCIDERDLLRNIERFIKAEIPKQVIEGFEPDPSIKAQPIFKQKQGRRSNGGNAGGRGNGNGNGNRGNRSDQNPRAKQGRSNPRNGNSSRPGSGNRSGQRRSVA